MPAPTIHTPTSLAELQTLTDAVRPEWPRRYHQFSLPLAEREPGYLRLACVRVVITPSLARQLLAHSAADPVVGLAGVVKFGGPASSDAVWSVPEGERKYRIGRVENVVRLAKIILAGEWDPNRLSAHALPDAQPVCGEPLSLTRDGIVIHGDHRLHAVDLTDLPIIDDFLAQ
jgi:hypothetical protein